MLTATEAARIIGIETGELHLLDAAGELEARAQTLGGRLLFAPIDVLRWIAGRREVAK